MALKTRKSKKIHRTSRGRSKKPKVILSQSKVYTMCAVICIVCGICLGLTVAFRPSVASGEKKSEKTTVQQAHSVKEPAVSQPVTSAPEKTSSVSKKKSVQPPKKENLQKTQPVQNLPSKNLASDSSASKAGAGKQESATAVKKSYESLAPARIASAKSSAQYEHAEKQVPKNRFAIPPAKNGASVAIVIDDAGRSVENVKRYAYLPFPVTIAVLPKLPDSRRCADAVRNAGQEVILHQPMQAENLALDPGPGAIRADMNTYEIAAVIKQNLMELGPGIKGMNNHEGSLITANEVKIGAVLDVCAELGVYFLDSRTTAATKAPQAALERDMHIYEKAGPYLDNEIDREKMISYMIETLSYANRHGRAIVIGHVDKSVNILPDLLSEMYPYMKAAGYNFCSVSQLR